MNKDWLNACINAAMDSSELTIETVAGLACEFDLQEPTDEEIRACWSRAVGYAWGEHVANFYETSPKDRSESFPEPTIDIERGFYSAY